MEPTNPAAPPDKTPWAAPFHWFVKDPTGWRIRCSKGWWQFHVVDEKAEFDGVDMLEAVRQAIREPDFINLPSPMQGRSRRRRLYYRPAPDQHEGKMVRVVVETRALRRQGGVLTSYLVPGESLGEQRLWTKS